MPDSTQPPQKSPLPWRRRLHYRLIVSYGLLFIAVLSLLMALVINAIYGVQINQAEHSLEVQALLAANALEDPLSGYASELEAYERYESETEDSESGKSDDDGEDESDDRGDAASAVNASKIVAPVGTVADPAIDGVPADGTGRQGWAALQHLADRYAVRSDLWVTIFDVRGDPVVDSRRAVGAIGNQIDAPEIQAAIALYEQHDIRLDPSTGEAYLFAAAPVQVGENLLGVVRMAQPMSEVRAPIRVLARNLFLFGVAALILATVLGIWLAHRLVQPIRKLEETALAVASGDLSRTADIRSTDEIGSLARTFDYMVGELQQTMRRQRLFIANASHELRTPLANIKLRSEALLSLDGEDPALSKRYLREIDSEADRLGRMAAVMLDLSKIDNRIPAPVETPVDVRPMLRSVSRAMRMRMADAELRFSVRIDEDLPALKVRIEEIETIVLNLLDNAIKYTPPGGKVGLSAQVQTSDEEPLVEIAVSDSGPGIPAEDVDHIFEYFYRVDKARSRQSSGTGSGAGLGLAILQTLVTQNDGHIHVSSVENHGTIFIVCFPLPH